MVVELFAEERDILLFDGGGCENGIGVEEACELCNDGIALVSVSIRL